MPLMLFVTSTAYCNLEDDNCTPFIDRRYSTVPRFINALVLQYIVVRSVSRDTGKMRFSNFPASPCKCMSKMTDKYFTSG